MVSPSERVLITGAGGFTGRLLVKSLRAAGREIVGLTQHSDDQGAIVVDLLNLEALSGIISSVRPAIIVHLAGVATTAHDTPENIYMANVVGTANLFEAISAAKLDLRSMIVASSAKVYASPDPPAPITEHCPLDPRSHYSVSKRTVEDITRLSASRFPVILTRPFNYTGPGQTTDFLVPKIVQHFVMRQSDIRLGDLDVYRDFSDVRRVVEAYARLVAGSFGSTIVNICSGRKIHLKGIISTMQEISGHDLRVISDAALMRSGEPREIWGSSAKLEALVGELPNPDFRETLESMYGAG